MLELLHGPAPRLLADASPAPDVTGTFWVDEIGLCAWHHGGAVEPSYYITQLDGLTHLRGGTQAGLTNWAHFSIEQNSPNIYTVDVTKENVYSFDTQVGNIIELFQSSSTINQFDKCDVLCTDRWVTARRFTDTTLRVSYKPIDGSGAFVVEASISGIPTRTGTDGLCTWSQTGRLNEFYIITDAGVAIRYNVATKEFFPGTLAYLPANRKAWYSARFNVFVVLFEDDTMSIYAATPRPYLLSNPAPVAPLVRGQLCTVQTQLLGQDNEPCPDEVITWTLVSGDGDLLTAQSTTDLDGYAQALYLAPMTGGINPTIQVQARF